MPIFFGGNQAQNSQSNLEWRKGTKLQSEIEINLDPLTYSLQELRETFIDNSLDDSSINIGKPDAHESSYYQEDGQTVNVLRFFACP